jgi:hypothetical protein
VGSRPFFSAFAHLLAVASFELASMSRAVAALSLGAAVLFGNAAHGARIFLSPSASSPDWQTIGQQTFVAGASTSLYVWVLPDAGETLNGVSLSLAATGTGSVQATAHSIYEPTLAGGLGRWDLVTVQDPQTLVPPPPLGTPGGKLNTGGLLFQDWNAVALINDTPIPGYTPNFGLDADNAGQDPLRDAASGAFLHSRLDVVGGSVGALNLFLQVGSRGVTSHLSGFDTLLFGDSSVAIDGGLVGASDPNPDALLRVVGVLGDTDGNGVVDLADLNNVRNHFGGGGPGDTDGDGLVSLTDLNNVRNQFGATAVASPVNSRLYAVPEPGGLLLAGGGVAGIFVFFGWRGCFGVLESAMWSGRADVSLYNEKEDHSLKI